MYGQQMFVDAEKLPTGWIKSVDVKRQVHWFGSSNTVLDLLDNTIHSNCVDFSCFHNLESAVSVILVITWSAQCGSNTSMNVGVIG